MTLFYDREGKKRIPAEAGTRNLSRTLFLRAAVRVRIQGEAGLECGLFPFTSRMWAGLKALIEDYYLE